VAFLSAVIALAIDLNMIHVEALFLSQLIINFVQHCHQVKRKLERNQYKTAKECAEDIRLVWINCKTYNADGSDFYLLAEGFSKKFEDRYKKIKAEYDTGDDEGKSAAQIRDEKNIALDLDVKTKFAGNLLLLSGMEIGHVMQVLDLRCPQALENPSITNCTNNNNDREMKRKAASNVEINVEAIDAKTFAELDRYVKEKMLMRSNGVAVDTIGSQARQRDGTVKKKQRT